MGAELRFPGELRAPCNVHSYLKNKPSAFSSARLCGEVRCIRPSFSKRSFNSLLSSKSQRNFTATVESTNILPELQAVTKY